MSAIVKFFLEGVCTGFLGLFGIVGNVVSIAVLSSTELDMMPSFRHLLKMLAAFDATFLVFTFSLFCISAWSEHYNVFIKPWLIPYFLPVIQISLTGSVWTTMAVSVERYLTVCLCYRGPTMLGGDWYRHLFYTLPIVGFSIIFNIPRFFELRTEIKSYNQTIFNETTGENETTFLVVPEVAPTQFREDPGYSRDYVLIANSLALVFIPMLALIVLNSLIFRTINQATQRHNAISSNQRRDHSVAMMLIFIVVVFVICHSIRSIINTYECIQLALHGKLLHWPDWVQTMVLINHFALAVNSSINILIYCCKDEKFLNVMLKKLGLSRFIRTASSSTAISVCPPTTARRNSLNGASNREARPGTGSTCSTSLRSSPPTHTSGNKQKLELQAMICTDHSGSGVTSALIPQSGSPTGLKKSPASAQKVTVDIISEKQCKVVKCDEKSALIMDSSTNCEECCRSCSCGETISSGEEESSEGINNMEETQIESNMAAATKLSAATQTPPN